MTYPKPSNEGARSLSAIGWQSPTSSWPVLERPRQPGLVRSLMFPLATMGLAAWIHLSSLDTRSVQDSSQDARTPTSNRTSTGKVAVPSDTENHDHVGGSNRSPETPTNEPSRQPLAPYLRVLDGALAQVEHSELLDVIGHLERAHVALAAANRLGLVEDRREEYVVRLTAESLRLGVVALDSGDTTLAVELFDMGLNLRPQHPGLLQMRREALRREALKDAPPLVP